MKMLSWITSTLLCMGFLLHTVMFSNFLGYDLMFSFLGIVFSGTFVYTGMLNFVGVDIIWVKLMLKSFLMMEVLKSSIMEEYYYYCLVVWSLMFIFFSIKKLFTFLNSLSAPMQSPSLLLPLPTSGLSLPSPTFMGLEDLEGCLEFYDLTNMNTYYQSLWFLSTISQLMIFSKKYTKDSSSFWEEYFFQVSFQLKQANSNFKKEVGDFKHMQSGEFSNLYFANKMPFNKELASSSGSELALFNKLKSLILLQSLGYVYISNKDMGIVFLNPQHKSVLDILTNWKIVPKKIFSSWFSDHSGSSVVENGSHVIGSFSLVNSALEGSSVDINNLKVPKVMSESPLDMFCLIVMESVKKHTLEDFQYLTKLNISMKEHQSTHNSILDLQSEEFTQYFLSSVVFLQEFKKLNLTEEQMSKVSLSNSGNTPASFMKHLEEKKEVSVGMVFKELFKKLFNKSYHMKDYYTKYGWDSFSTWKESGRSGSK